jgi:putative ABC transport system permease protein
MSLFQARLFFRIISKNREVYLLKIITLAIAFACSTLVILFSLNEFGYDQFHQDHHSIFRILQRNNHESFSGNRLSNRIPSEIFTSLRTKSADSIIISRVKVMAELNVIAGKKIFQDQKIHAADSEITSIFSFDVLDGSLSAFNEKENTVMLSSSAARQYLGTVHAAGKEIKIHSSEDTMLFSVAAVYKDYPQNSHEEFNIFARFNTGSISSLGFDHKDTGIYGRVLLRNKVYFGSAINNPSQSTELTYEFQPISEIYFGPRVTGEDARHGDHYSILILICITCLILFLALTSFINLTTLTLPYRSKELAVKKLAGTSQLNLISTFTMESFSIVGIALAMGVVLVLLTSYLILPILSINLISLLKENSLLLTLIMVALLMSGLAPLFMMLKFTQATPTRLLSTETITFPRFKRVIMFLQLGISIFLIVASIVIKRQVNYSLLKEPGRNHDQVVYMSYPKGLTNEGLRSIRDGWKKNNANIVDVMATSQLPDQINSKELNSEFYFMAVDPAFKDFFNLRMVQGNWFKANDGDSIAVVNEKGKEILGNNMHNVIGVFENLNGMFNQPEKPIKINIAPYFNYNFLCIRILEVDIRRTVDYLSTFFEPRTQKASVYFFNKRFDEWMRYQDRLNTLSEILAIISGLLSCCAIYGLIVSIVRDKLKQIAIHKMCGASLFNITRLLINEFARQMLIAILIFGPLTYIVIKELLRNFVYSTHFTLLDPVLPIVYCGLVITMLCGFQALSLNRADLSSALKG